MLRRGKLRTSKHTKEGWGGGGGVKLARIWQNGGQQTHAPFSDSYGDM